jgi:hypothetical protein
MMSLGKISRAGRILYKYGEKRILSRFMMRKLSFYVLEESELGSDRRGHTFERVEKASILIMIGGTFDQVVQSALVGVC